MTILDNVMSSDNRVEEGFNTLLEERSSVGVMGKSLNVLPKVFLLPEDGPLKNLLNRWPFIRLNCKTLPDKSIDIVHQFEVRFIERQLLLINDLKRKEKGSD